jgi:novobiocin biosynthesis protein NovU/D-mycarose 3-C-methyltransferase
MFRNYAYRSSASKTIPRHFREFAEFIHARYLASSKDLVVEIGSNDGTLLSVFKKLGCNVLGIDPAANLASLANYRGLETIPEFFSSSLAFQVLEKKGPARVIIGNNVFGHVDDLRDFLKGIVALLEVGGFLSIEVPYLGDLNQNVEYDTIYHEHLSYFSLRPLERLFSEFGLQVIHVDRLQVHGGSIRVIGRKSKHKTETHPFLTFEKRGGLGKIETYRSLSYRVEYQKQYLNYVLDNIRARGHLVVGYGAPAKGNTLLNVCGIGTDKLDYLIDTTPEKIGKFAPGTHIPIYTTQRFRKDSPPFALMLAWNYQEEILFKEVRYRGQFIIPIPYPRILPKAVRVLKS